MAYPVSDRFKRTVTAPHQTAVTVEVVRSGVTVAADLWVSSSSGGNVTVDRSADVRRTCSLTVGGVPRDLIPTRRQRSPLDIYGNELVIKSGVRYPDGSVELVPMGVLEITDSDLVDTSDGVGVSVKGHDRSGTIGKNRGLTPWATANGTDVITAITALADNRFPGITVVDLTSATDTFPTHILEEDANPWVDGIDAFASAVGAVPYPDRSGRLIVQDVPDLTAVPVAWRFVEGADCVVTKLTRSYSQSAGGVNAVTVTGENADTAPVYATALDLDPESPTYYYGTYRGESVSESSPLITTTAQAQRVADARGRELFGMTEKVVVTIVPNAAVDEGDVIYVRRERTGFDDVMVVDSFDFPLGLGGDMAMNCWVLRSA